MVTKSDVVEKLDRLASFQAELQVLEFEKQALIDQVLTPEIKARMEEIEAEFARKGEAANQNITRLEGEIREDVLQYGSTVKGVFLRATWNHGRVTWVTNAMENYAKTHPEILEFRKEGKPYISIVKIKDD